MKRLVFVGIICCFALTISAQYPHNVQIIHKKHDDGSKIVYMTIDSVIHGLYIGYDSLGRLEYESCYVNGIETGPFRYYYSNGNIASECYYLNGRPDGKSVDYFPNGKIKTISYWEKGSQNSIGEMYIEDGRLDKRLLYRNDTLIYIIEDHHYRPLPPTVEPLYQK